MDVSRLCAAALAASLLVLAPTPGTAGCEGCHGDPAHLVKNRKLYDYYQDWLTSPHKQAGVTCDRCHGGDAEADGVDAAHAGRVPVTDPRSTVFFKRQPETCGRCHPAIAEQFSESPHCSKLLGETMAPSCSTCHRAMNKKPYYRDILREGCRHCHDSERGVARPQVIDQADEILHRMNISRGFLGWTTLHYERAGWPGDSRERVDGLWQTYHGVLARVHSLQFLAAEEGSVDLLATLKQGFKDARASGPAAAPGAERLAPGGRPAED